MSHGPKDSANMALTPETASNTGARIRQERIRQGISARELARRVGLTGSYISKIERGATNPTIGTLWKICDQLGMHMSVLFPSEHGTLREDGGVGHLSHGHGIDDSRLPPEGSSERIVGGGEGITVVERANRERIQMAGVEWQRLTPPGDETIEFVECRYDVGASEKEAYRHRGREYVVVEQGHLLVEVGFSKIVLGPGSSTAFESSIPHRYSNVGDEPMVAIWVVTHDD